jgi:hypothetical protein
MRKINIFFFHFKTLFFRFLKNSSLASTIGHCHLFVKLEKFPFLGPSKALKLLQFY